MRKIYIFGAHSRARTLHEYLSSLYDDIILEAYLVDNMLDNEPDINGIPVFEISHKNILDTECPVYIATRGEFHKKIKRALYEIGFKNVIPVDVDLDIILRNKYVRKVFENTGRDFTKLNEIDFSSDKSKNNLSARIYVASFIDDKPLQQQYVYDSCEEKIQVGASLTDKKVTDCFIFDNTGTNISQKNKQYCELTALYWIWKNSIEDIVGLVHYRRHFILPDNWKNCIESGKADVILPVPLYVSPTIAQNYKFRHDGSDWDIMMKCIKKIHPEHYDVACNFFDTSLYSPCNMLITKREILSSYCEWLFPVIDDVFSQCGTKDDIYMNRYPGFLSERLLSFYFYLKRFEYKVIYCDKNFLC